MKFYVQSINIYVAEFIYDPERNINVEWTFFRTSGTFLLAAKSFTFHLETGSRIPTSQHNYPQR
jgi:hypothetical protein